MSLLRDVLKRGRASNASADPKLPLSSKRNLKSYASSVKSSGGASMRSLAESVSSFYSAITGSGPRVAKRRRADFSRLGVPEWYSDDPPPAPEMPGTELPGAIPPYTMAHAELMRPTQREDEEPWLGLVLYSHAPATAVVPMYHNGGKFALVPPSKIAGELRMKLDKPTNLSSIDIWFTLASDSVIDMLKPPILTMTASMWNRKKGDPTARTPGGVPFKGKFPAGTFVFPFEFAALPLDTLVNHPDEERRKNKARVPLPPTYSIAVVGGFSGNIKYQVGANITREGFTSVDEEFEMTVQYLPLSRATPRLKTPFPYIPTREDWPLRREIVGGWTLTPFGGRGRLGDELVELEGILGIQEPAVYTAGQTLEFSLLLWSASPLALEALAQPGAVEAGLYKSDVFALDALHPKNSSRKNRRLERLAAGRVWLTDAGRPADGAPPPVCALVELPEAAGAKPPPSPSAGTSRAARAPPSSRMRQVWVAEEDEKHARGSPTPSLEALDDAPDPERVVRLDGEVRVPACSHPSFRYQSMGREYVLHILIRHPQYLHISPSATGVIGEVPVWYVLDRFAGGAPGGEGTGGASGGAVDLSALPIKGDTLQLPSNAVRLPLSIGTPTTEKRPTFRAQRVAAF
ncbi:hypothetical protein C8J57DRAFT_1728400 [Mycena rebaudengoi]|nr:hypothetical protein C8J57DRAFT_1728400 [Mycena rebaudengoi]